MNLFLLQLCQDPVVPLPRLKSHSNALSLRCLSRQRRGTAVIVFFMLCPLAKSELTRVNKTDHAPQSPKPEVQRRAVPGRAGSSSRLQRHQAQEQTLSFEGVRDGALLRLQPISMTAAAIIVGLLPVMYGSGTGSEVMRRIAAPMVGGMLSALVQTMLVIPAVYLLWEWRRLQKTLRQ